MHRLWTARTGGFVAAGVLAGAGAWLLGPRAALAVMVGFSVIGGLVVLDWLVFRHRLLSAELARLGRKHRDDLAALEKRLRRELVGLEQRVRAAYREELATIEGRFRTNLSTMEKRLRISASGDMLAMEKRLRTDRAATSGAAER